MAFFNRSELVSTDLSGLLWSLHLTVQDCSVFLQLMLPRGAGQVHPKCSSSAVERVIVNVHSCVHMVKRRLGEICNELCAGWVRTQ